MTALRTDITVRCATWLKRPPGASDNRLGPQ